MIQQGKLIISAAVMALILFIFPAHLFAALPLTETLYFIPDGEIELFFRGEVHRVNRDFRVEHPGIGIGILPDCTVWFHFMYLHDDASEWEGEAGDSFLKVLCHAGDYFHDRVHAGVMVRFRFPTGRSAFSSDAWQNLSLGRNEVRAGPVVKFDLPGSFYLHTSLFYTFRQAGGEDFYGGFSFNPAQSETYRRLFGLNPFEDGTFLSRDRLENDFISISICMNTGTIYPFIPFVELYTSRRFYRGEVACSSVPVEGCGIDPLLVCAGSRYFFSRAVYAGAYVIYNPVGESDYTRWVSGLEVSLQF